MKDFDVKLFWSCFLSIIKTPIFFICIFLGVVAVLCKAYFAALLYFFVFPGIGSFFLWINYCERVKKE